MLPINKCYTNITYSKTSAFNFNENLVKNIFTNL